MEIAVVAAVQIVTTASTTIKTVYPEQPHQPEKSSHSQQPTVRLTVAYEKIGEYYSALCWLSNYIINITLRGKIMSMLNSCPDPPTSAARVDAGVDCAATSERQFTIPGAKHR